MYKPNFQKRNVLKFTHFSNHGYSLFSVLGKEVLIGVLSVATLQHATAKGISIEVDKAQTDSLVANHGVMMEEVSVTGTRAPLTVSQQARMVTVLSREDIQAAPVQSINDLLKYAVGVDVRQKGPLGALTDVSIRGGNSEQITILLNGINIGDAQTGHNAFDFPVDLNEIERIEILEGPAARVYGTSSLLGAINIVTSIPQNKTLSAYLEGGSFGYFKASARANISKREWSNQLSTSFMRSDGYLRNKAGGLNSDYKTGKAFYQGSYRNNEVMVKWHAGLSIKDFGSSTFYSSKYDNQFEHTLKTFTAIQAENVRGKIHIHPAIYWNRSMDRFELFRDAPEKYPFNYHRTDVYGVNLNAYFDWKLGRTAVGTELRNEDLVSTNLGEPLSRSHHIHGTDHNYINGLNRTNLQFIAEHNFILERFTLSAGLIAVKNSQADMPMRVYPGIDISYRFNNTWKIYASYNSSLRMPSITELFYSVGGHKADKHLKPEELSAVEMGIKYEKDAISAKASIYLNHHKDLIDWISDGTLDENGAILWKSVNFGTINDLGVEANIDMNFQKILSSQHVLKKLSLGYSYINQDKTDNEGIVSKYALEYLKNKFVSTLNLHIWKNLDLDLKYRFQHRMGYYLDMQNEKQRYTSYGIVDGRLKWNDKKWTAYIEANNIFNSHYIDYGNIPQPGIWVISGISIHL